MRLPLTVHAVRTAGIVNTSTLGIPLSIVNTAAGEVKVFVRICAHEWVWMREPALRNNCLVCPLHGVTFDASSGGIANTRGKRISEGLRQVAAEIVDDTIVVRITGAEYLYLFKVHLKRTARVLFRTGKRRKGRS